MRLFGIGFAVALSLIATSLFAKDRPLVKSSEAAAQAGNFAIVSGRVIEVRRVANGPIIFELDGRPSAPTFRALVYPMATARFGSDPENIYLGQQVEVTGLVQVRDNLPQMWINDPTHIRLRKIEQSSEPSPPPPPRPGAGV
jgi:hypothetical protein